MRQCDRSANDPRQYPGIAVPQPELEKIDLLPVGNRKNRFSEPLEMASREGRFGLPIYRSAIPILCIPISILCIPICVSAKRGLTLEQLRRHVQC